MRLVVLACAIALLAPSARAIDGDGHIGLSYMRTDAWDPDGVRSSSPRLSLDLGLRLSGYVSSHDTLDWSVGASYRRLSWKDGGNDSAFENWLFYDARIRALSHKNSPVTLSLDASRGTTEFSTTADPNVTGDTITQTAGGVLSLRVADRPSLTAGYRRIDSETSIPGVGITERSIDRITGTFASGTPVFNLSANYNGDLSTGTYLSDRADQHTLVVNNSVPLGSTVEVVASDIFQKNKPHEMGVGAIDQENNVFRVFGWNRGDPGNRHALGYTYSHSLAQTASSPLQEGARQAVRYDGDHLLTFPTLFTRWFVDGSFQQARSGGTELRTTGETLGVQLNWLPHLPSGTLELAAGPSVGFIQSDGGDDSTGWGASGFGRARLPWGPHNVSVDYNIDYGSDQFGNPGWTLRQAVTAAMGGPAWGWTYNASLSGSGYRLQSPIFGAAIGRSLDLYGMLVGPGTTVEFRGSLQEGMSGATPANVVGDGLFIPAQFDSKTRSALLRATTTLYAGLSATGHLRYLNTVYPGRPSLDQAEALAALRYNYGALTFALEDRLTRYEQASGWSTVNQVMVLVSRAIGWRGY